MSLVRGKLKAASGEFVGAMLFVAVAAALGIWLLLTKAMPSG